MPLLSLTDEVLRLALPCEHRRILRVVCKRLSVFPYALSVPPLQHFSDLLSSSELRSVYLPLLSQGCGGLSSDLKISFLLTDEILSFYS